jgi:hypothetical protein
MEIITVDFPKNSVEYSIYDMILWCEQNIGKNYPGNWVFSNPGNWYERTWAVSNQFDTVTFYFRDSKDAVLFTLRWR